jgi:hypothetical protein
LSFLHKASSAPISPSFSQVGLSWAEFVQLVLSLTIQAYGMMKQTCALKQNWEENVFTVNLEDYLRPLAYDYSIFVQTRTKQHTTKMRTGEQATIEAKEMDMILFGSWERAYHDVHFVWEAKRVGDKRVNSDYGGLNSEYVHEAIYRFIRNEYAADVADAGVLAYVLAGDVANIVADINQSMGNIRKNSPLNTSNHLQIASPVHQFDTIYQSSHMRVDSSIIQLHHLFLTFDFVA